MSYGVTLTGFVSKDLQTIKSELEAEFKSSYGNDLDVSSNSVTGQLIGNLSKKFVNLWELAQAVYAAFNPDSATGNALDGALALVGLTRLNATSSTVVEALYGDIGTLIPSGHLIRQSITNEDFSLDEDVTISLSSIIDSTISIINVLNNQLYTVTINGNAYTYTSDGTATDLEIIAGLKAAIDLGSDPVTVNDNLDGTMQILSDDGITAFSLVVDANLQVDVQATPGNYSAVNTGALSVPSNSVNIIVNSVSGLDSVNNIAAGVIGVEIETDEEMRTRRRDLLTGIGAATDEAIRAALLQEVVGVTTAFVISNRTDSTDGDGRPPHSFETVVVGGDEQEIANKIWEKQPSGIQPYGSISKTVVDSQGNNQTVEFSRPTNVYIWIDLEYALYNEEIFPANGEDLVKAAIATWAEENLTIGNDVIYLRLSIPIYTVPGIGDITIELATSATPLGPPGAYSSADVPIASNEVALFDIARMTLTQV